MSLLLTFSFFNALNLPQNTSMTMMETVQSPDNFFQKNCRRCKKHINDDDGEYAVLGSDFQSTSSKASTVIQFNSDVNNSDADAAQINADQCRIVSVRRF